MSYSVTGSQDHCYPDSTVLVNRLNLRSQEQLDQAEKIAVSYRSMELEKQTITEPFTFEFYCGLHRILFGDIYEWAGEVRTADITKKGTRFCPAAELNRSGKALFEYLMKQNELKELPRDEFCLQVAELYNDINMLHPFREGNGRTQRLFFTLLIRRAGYEISFADGDPDELMMATIYAAQGVMDFLQGYFEKNIHKPIVSND